MFERAALYGVITYIGNENIPEPPLGLYAKEAGGNADTSQKYAARKARYQCETDRRDYWFGETYTLSQLIPDQLFKHTGRWRPHKRQALSFMMGNDAVSEAFIKNVYGDAQAAYWNTNNKDDIYPQFLNWFYAQRKELRKKMGADLSQVVNTEIVKTARPKGVISHGGVANLLKVLTKTMEQQGADIRNIAKMQYTICRQAGILIPDEFIEDVAVVLSASGELS